MKSKITEICREFGTTNPFLSTEELLQECRTMNVKMNWRQSTIVSLAESFYAQK